MRTLTGTLVTLAFLTQTPAALDLAPETALQTPPVRTPASEGAHAAIADLAWIAGGWAGGTTTTFEEHWTTPAGGGMLGVARTIKDNRMVAFEFLRIVERNGTLVYIAQPNGAPPTEFTLTQFDGESAVFENPSHDYPKMIRYAKRSDGGLEARISAEAGKRPQTFVFQRQR